MKNESSQARSKMHPKYSKKGKSPMRYRKKDERDTTEVRIIEGNEKEELSKNIGPGKYKEESCEEGILYEERNMKENYPLLNIEMVKTTSELLEEDDSEVPDMRKEIEKLGNDLNKPPHNPSFLSYNATIGSPGPDALSLDEQFGDIIRYDSLIEDLTQLKDEANDLYKKASFQDALDKYVEISEQITDETVEEFGGTNAQWCTNLKVLKGGCILNASHMQLLLGSYSQALTLAQQALLIDEGNAKAHYRKGQANKHMENYIHAMNDFDRAFRLSTNPNYHKEYNDMKKLVELEEHKLNLLDNRPCNIENIKSIKNTNKYILNKRNKLLSKKNMTIASITIGVLAAGIILFKSLKNK